MKRLTCFFLIFLSVFVFLYARPGDRGARAPGNKTLTRIIRHQFERRLTHVRKHMKEKGKSKEEIDGAIRHMRQKFSEEAEKIKNMPDAEKLLYLQKIREKQIRNDLNRKGASKDKIETHIVRMKQRHKKMFRRHQDTIMKNTLEHKRKELESKGLSEKEIQIKLSDYWKKIHSELTGKEVKSDKPKPAANSRKAEKNRPLAPETDAAKNTQPVEKRKRRASDRSITTPVSTPDTDTPASLEDELDQVKSDIIELKEMIRELKEAIKKREGR